MTSFATSFETLTGHPPLLWQSRLYEELIRARLPSALDLPTGLGKTSVIAIWLIARSCGADLPRRLVYVVDRRAVVDQATEVATSIAKVLGDGTDAADDVQGLRHGLGLAVGMTLPISTLRGQHVDNREWLESPARPAVVVGTIDMIGSRLLFQGYGVSPRMRSVHAALLGADALVVLDEAHLVPPFEHLLRAISAWPRARGIPPFRLLTLSATGRTEGDAPFRLTSADLEDERTSARLRATKRLKLQDPTADLVEALAQRALELAGSSSRVIAFCDSRKVAQKVADRLGTLARAKFGKGAQPPALLVGGRRVWERAQLADDVDFRRFRPHSAEATVLTAPAFLVATSAGEVGVDLDADHLVMDLVPWERMVQRLGRVNRRAEPGESLVDVFTAVPDKEAESGRDKDIDELRRWRAPFETAAWPTGGDGRLDASPLGLLQLREDADFVQLTKAASTSEPLHPDLSGPLLDAWAMTSLDEHPGRPEVAPWLRGWIDDEEQTRLVWRRLFPIRSGDLEGGRVTRALQENLKKFFASAAPHLSETLDVPTYQAVELLRKRAASWSNSRAANSESETETNGDVSPFAVILDSRGEFEAVQNAEQLAEMDPKYFFRLLVGRTVVLDARLGGLGMDGLLDVTCAEPPLTLDASSAEAEEWTGVAGFRVRKVNRSDNADTGDSDWPVDYRLELAFEGDGEGEELRVEVLRTKAATTGDAAIARIEQVLSEHHTWTADAARRIAKALSLPAYQEDLLVAAAAIHDAGKARALWQNAMRAPRTDRPYAKTRGGGDFRALLLDGATYRHEFGSVGDAERDAAIMALPDDHRDLVLHLVAAHHGYARPVITPVDPDAPPSLTVQRARAVALRFHRLHRLWGPWGLAWWESLLRAADWAASRAANERKGHER